LHYHVGTSHELAKELTVGMHFDVERDALLTAIDIGKVGALSIHQRCEGARYVARRRPFNFTTRAPSSASSIVQNGPESACVRSAIRTPANGPCRVPSGSVGIVDSPSLSVGAWERSMPRHPRESAHSPFVVSSSARSSR